MNRKYLLGIIVLLGLFIVFKFIDGKDDFQGVPENEINESLIKETDEKKDLQTQDLIIFIPNETFTGLEERPITLSNPENLSTVELLIDALSESGKNKTEYNKPIPSYIKINKAYKKNETVFIDISSKSIQSDSARESLIIDSLILTMTTLDGVDNIKILKDGKNTEKFMGAFDVSDKLGIDDITNNVFYIDYLKEKAEEKSKDDKEDKKAEDKKVEDKKIEKKEVLEEETQDESNQTVEESGEEIEDDDSEEIIPSEPIPMSIGNN